MSYNKRFSLRLIVLDGLLRKKEGVSMKEILQVVNNDLELHGVCPVKSKETLLQDMIELGNSYHVVIVKFKDKSDHRIIRYRYENLSFSIFKSPLSDAEIYQGLFQLAALLPHSRIKQFTFNFYYRIQ